ncbi:MAG: efflux RND transporter periplasmic adaptor subunit [Planctomycetes bacterium]|nr:efflux RND transporter periplasmic adaptor subunit [Planctomycetota bacterium]
MNKLLVALLIVILVILGAGWAAWRYDWGPLAAANSSWAPGDGREIGEGGASAVLESRNVHALGRLEPVGGIITISGMVGDRVEELLVQAGDFVQEGAVLARLASHPLRTLEVEALEAQIAESKARRQAEEAAADARIRVAEVNLRKAQSRQAEIDAQEKQVALAEANLEVAKNDLQRMEGLSSALVSKQEFERQRLLVQKAEAELAAAKAARDTAIESGQFAEEAALAELDAARASKAQVASAVPIASLEKQRDVAKLQAQQTVIKAPAPGTVLKIFTREGEVLANKPILQMADLAHLRCIAEVYEGDLPRVEIGQAAIITGRGFPERYRGDGVRGVVSRIGGMTSTPELRAIDPFAPTDRHVVEVYIRFPEGAIPEAAQLANLQVDVTILTSDGESSDENSPGVAQSRP